LTIQMRDLRVLVVEDNLQAANLLKKVLGALGIHQVYSSVDGQEAQQLLDSARDMVDVIICDWEMPNMTGIELLKQVHTYYPSMPFIMLTGNADPESVKAAARFDVNGYIVKPYTPQQIADSLTTLIMTLELEIDTRIRSLPTPPPSLDENLP